MRASNTRGTRAIATVVLCAFFPIALSGCFGRFELVRKTYDFNKEISPDKWIQWLFFLLITIVPIYGVATLVDAIVMNSIEFWTGNNPVLAGTQRTFRGEEGDVALVTYGENRTVYVEITRSDGSQHVLQLVRESDSILALDGAGQRIARVGEIDGQPALLAD